MYGVKHPSARHEIDNWFKHLAPFLRSKGAMALGTDGQTAFVDGDPISTANPIILALLQQLHAARAGVLELRSGLSIEDAARLADFLNHVDTTRVVGDDQAIQAWLERSRIRHIRVKQLTFREIKEGDQIVRGDFGPSPQRHTADRRTGPSARPKEALSWARDFEQEMAQTDASGGLPPETRDVIADHLRGIADVPPGELSMFMARAAEEPDGLASLILKTAVIEHEVAQRQDEPVGKDIVTCMQKVLGALQKSPTAGTEEGLNSLLAIIAALEQSILERLEALAGGTRDDAALVSTGAREMEHGIHGVALKREHAESRKALQDVERRVREFFGAARFGAES